MGIPFSEACQASQRGWDRKKWDSVSIKVMLLANSRSSNPHVLKVAEVEKGTSTGKEWMNYYVAHLSCLLMICKKKTLFFCSFSPRQLFFSFISSSSQTLLVRLN